MKIDPNSFYKLCDKNHVMKKVSFQTFRTGVGHQVVKIGYYCTFCRILVVTKEKIKVEQDG